MSAERGEDRQTGDPGARWRWPAIGALPPLQARAGCSAVGEGRGWPWAAPRPLAPSSCAPRAPGRTQERLPTPGRGVAKGQASCALMGGRRCRKSGAGAAGARQLPSGVSGHCPGPGGGALAAGVQPCEWALPACCGSVPGGLQGAPRRITLRSFRCPGSCCPCAPARAPGPCRCHLPCETCSCCPPARLSAASSRRLSGAPQGAWGGGPSLRMCCSGVP